MQKQSVCPNNKNFVFNGKCPIDTCQFNNSKTSRGCLSLDISSAVGHRSDAAVTDQFLLQFKILPNADKFDSKNHNEKFAEYARKKAVNAAKANMTLYLFCHWIRSTLKPNENFSYNHGSNSLIENLLNSFPLNQVELKFEIWMLYYAANPKCYAAFIADQKRKDESIELVHVLGLTPGKHKTLIETIKSCTLSKSKPRRKAKTTE